MHTGVRLTEQMFSTTMQPAIFLKAPTSALSFDITWKDLARRAQTHEERTRRFPFVFLLSSTDVERWSESERRLLNLRHGASTSRDRLRSQSCCWVSGNEVSLETFLINTICVRLFLWIADVIAAGRSELAQSEFACCEGGFHFQNDKENPTHSGLIRVNKVKSKRTVLNQHFHKLITVKNES